MTYQLRPNPALHERRAIRVPVHRLDVVIQTRAETSHGQQPEDNAEGYREADFDRAGLALEVEGDEDCNGYDSHVGC